MEEFEREILDKVRMLLSEHSNIEGMSLEEGLPIIRDKEHPLCKDRERYAGTIYKAENSERWYDIERSSASVEWWIEHANNEGRWNRHFCHFMVNMAKHPHLPPEWAEWIVFMAEKDIESLRKVVEERQEKTRWAVKSWPYILHALAGNEQAVPEELRVKAEQLSRDWKRLWLRMLVCDQSEAAQ